MRIKLKFLRLCFLLVVFIASPTFAAETDWLHGKWYLSYDPDGGEKDSLEFFENGDVYSLGKNGRITGFYIVNETQVKVVFTYKEQDFIMNFSYDSSLDALKIITSHTGLESIYIKENK